MTSTAAHRSARLRKLLTRLLLTTTLLSGAGLAGAAAWAVGFPDHSTEWNSSTTGSAADPTQHKRRI
ncbi:hypothetical protein CFP65_5778 [Kitasatospora sp. MMS16-BH015]|uniref:hypothetical protein n=1 Tax=Kitasatospora sp. MMS16-BH015 TaxID=2018025 RepID=UPI000CA161C6|nr:hypothetical protein [Kitasatospora sp. MMS16-BH015]AUG80464.1 hypothetical protein CFP65_5778 [Kitasatospora sp. MMS16-BH015]